MNTPNLLLFSLFLAFNLSVLKASAASKKLLSPEDICHVIFSLPVPINRLGLSINTENHLKAANITRLGDLAVMTEEELLAIPGIEESSLAEIKHQFSGVKLLMSYEEIQGLINRSNRTEEPQDKSKDTSPQTSDNSSDFLNRLNTRTRNVLRDMKVRSLEELAMLTEEELSKVPRLGKKSIKDIKTVLAEEGLHLGFLSRFKTRARKALEAMGIRSFEKLAMLTEEELSKIPRLGKKSIEDIKTVLAEEGLHLGMKSADESSEAVTEGDEQTKTGDRKTSREIQPDSHIDSLKLPDEISRILETERITNIGDLVEMTEEELLIILSPSEFVEVKNRLSEAGFYFGMKGVEQQETGKKLTDTVDDNVGSKKSPVEDSRHQATVESAQTTVPFSFIFVIPISYFQFQNVNSHAMTDSLLSDLGNNRIKDIGDLVTKTREEVLKIPGVGQARLSEIEFSLEGKNLSLGMKIEGWPLNQNRLEKMRQQLGTAIEDGKDRYHDVFEIARDLTVSNPEMCRKTRDCSIRPSGAL